MDTITTSYILGYDAKSTLWQKNGIAQATRWSLRLAIMLVALLAFGVVEVRGQSQSSINGQTPAGAAPGTPSGSYILSNIDSVSLYSGRVNAALPLLQIGGRGSAGFTMSVAVDQSRWVTEWSIPVPGVFSLNVYDAQREWSPWSLGPLKLEPGYLTQRTTRLTPFNPVDSNDPPTAWRSGATSIVFQTADGTEHFLYDVQQGGVSSDYIDGPHGWVPDLIRGRVFTARDGSGLTFVSDEILDVLVLGFNEGTSTTSSTLETPGTGYLKTPDGTTYRVENGIVQWIRDRNGNTTSFFRQSNQLKITDSIGRVTTADFNGNTIQIHYLGFGANQRTITLNYGSLSSNLRPNSGWQTGIRANLFPAFPVNGSTTGFSNAGQVYNPTVLSSITLANGQQYHFYYNPYGELAEFLSNVVYGEAQAAIL